MVKNDRYVGLDHELPRLSHIVRHLWMGGRPDSYSDFSLVVSCEKHLARKPMADWGGTLVHLPMEDLDGFSIPAGRIEAVARLVASWVGDVLVHCTGGLNRSGLVVVRAVELIEEIGARDALTLVRVRRDPWVLCNRAFERWVTGDVLPTAETSAFRKEA